MLPDSPPCTRRRDAYWSRCKCDTCSADRSRKRAYHYAGLPWRYPQEQAWAVLADKIDRGWTARAIGSATGLDDPSSASGRLYFTRHLTAHRNGRTVKLGPMVAAAIMNMGTPTEGQVGAEPSRRRLRALATIGHGLNSLTAETGLGFSTLAAIRNDKAERTGARVANVIAETYERLHMTLGDDEQAERIAREKNWPGPLAWDDIDDPNEQPKHNALGTKDPAELQSRLDMAVVWRLVDDGARVRKLSGAEAREAWRILVGRGLSTHEIEKRYGLNSERYGERVA